MRNWSVARQLFALQAAIILLLVVLDGFLSKAVAGDNVDRAVFVQSNSAARSVAASPFVRDALASSDPSAVLQAYTEEIRKDTGVDFVTVMSTSGVQYTSPDTSEIGRQYPGSIARALAGEVVRDDYTGAAGPSTRVVVPVYSPDHRVVGLVSAGVRKSIIARELLELQRPLLQALVNLSMLGVGLVGNYLISTRLQRQTHSLKPAQLNRVIGYHESILHSVREGLLLLDTAGTVTLCNDGARELLDLGSQDVDGRALDSLGLPRSLVTSLLADGQLRDEIHVTDSHVLLVNKSSVDSRGWVVTVRDHTELETVTGELDVLKGLAESMRSQAHESANRLHAVVSLIELGRSEEAVSFATREMELAQLLTDTLVSSIDEPVLVAFLLSKAAQANERGVDLIVTDDTAMEGSSLQSRDLVTIVGKLIDNAMDASIEGGNAPTVVLTLRTTDEDLVIRVADTGQMTGDADESGRGWSTKDGSRGLALALVRQAVHRNGGTIEVGQDEGTVYTVRLPREGKRQA
ncbi:ATP-binding protein [Lentzea sp. NPDC059081]|uniref:sensor histidine kinase n=1 Tax=Lentzea sp. NPDC059081 TaxID=3346719 RepID=UPI0036C3C0B2